MSKRARLTRRHLRLLVGFLLVLVGLLGLSVDRYFEAVWNWLGGSTAASFGLLVVCAALLVAGVWLVAADMVRGRRAALVRGESAEAAGRLREKIDAARTQAGEKIADLETGGLDPALVAVLNATAEQLDRQQLINRKILEISEDLLEREVAASEDRAGLHERVQELERGTGGAAGE